MRKLKIIDASIRGTIKICIVDLQLVNSDRYAIEGDPSKYAKAPAAVIFPIADGLLSCDISCPIMELIMGPYSEPLTPSIAEKISIVR